MWAESLDNAMTTGLIESSVKFRPRTAQQVVHFVNSYNLLDFSTRDISPKKKCSFKSTGVSVISKNQGYTM